MLTYQLDDVIPVITQFMNSMEDLYDTAYKLKLPILTADFLANDMVILKFVQENFKDNQTIIDVTEQILERGLNGSEDFLKMIQAMESHFRLVTENIGTQIDAAKDSYIRSTQKRILSLTEFGNLRSQILKT